MSNLSAELETFRQQFTTNVPEEVLQTLLAETENWSPRALPSGRSVLAINFLMRG